MQPEKPDDELEASVRKIMRNSVPGLSIFVVKPDGVRWAHLDIAGPSFNDGQPHGYTPKGGTGAATRALVQIALDAAEGRL